MKLVRQNKMLVFVFETPESLGVEWDNQTKADQNKIGFLIEVIYYMLPIMIDTFINDDIMFEDTCLEVIEEIYDKYAFDLSQPTNEFFSNMIEECKSIMYEIDYIEPLVNYRNNVPDLTTLGEEKNNLRLSYIELLICSHIGSNLIEIALATYGGGGDGKPYKKIID